MKEQASNMLQIRLEDLSQPDWKLLYVASRGRYATATSVRFLDPGSLVCCSLLGQKMYLIRFYLHSGSYRIVHSIDTIFEGKSTPTDLCDTDGNGLVITSNCSHGSVSLYRCTDDRITFVRDLPLDLDIVHGVKFVAPGIAAITVTHGERGVHFIDIETMERILYIASEWRTKDVCFISDTRLAVLTADGAPAREQQGGYDSCISLVDFNLRERSYRTVAQAVNRDGQLDACVLHDDKLYVTDQAGDCVWIHHPGDLRRLGEIRGFDMPHGIDIRHGLMAVTNYGSNTVEIREMQGRLP